MVNYTIAAALFAAAHKRIGFSGGAIFRRARKNKQKRNIMTYDDLKLEDAEAMERLNEKNRWALSGKELEQLAAAHKAARLAGDEYECLLIEYRLDDMNFHTEARHLHAGEYGKALEAYADALAPVQP